MQQILKSVIRETVIVATFLTAGMSLIPSLAWAALTVLPSGLTATATQTSANSTQWGTSGTEKYCWNANEWLEYQLDFGAGGSWILSLTATNQNSSSAPGLPSGYAFNIALSVDGASKGSLQVTGSTTTYRTGSSSPLTLTGIHTVRFTWTNDAYLAGSYDANIRVKQVSFLSSDVTPPTVTLSSPGPSATVSGTIMVSATASDSVGVVGVQFKLDGVNLGAEDTSSPYGVGWDTTTATNAGHALTAVARDAAGNSATSSSVSVTVNNVAADTTPPTGSITINAGTAATNSTAATLTLSATDTGGSVTQMRFSNDGSVFSTAEVYATSKSWTLASGDGAKTVYVQFKDAAGNWSSAPITDTIVLDTTAPAISVVTASSITATGATITWTTNETATTQVEYGLTATYGQSTTLDLTLVTSHSVGLSGLTASTLYHYRIRSKDAAGNEALGADATFTTPLPPDTTPPTGSVMINSGAPATNSTAVTLTLSATDDRGTVAQLQCSNDGATFAAAQPYATSVPWTLTTGDGQKTVYVKFKDTAGNWSTPASTATITLDTTPPQVSFTSPVDGAVITAPSP